MDLIKWIFKSLMFEIDRADRRDYYRKEYLKSNAWKRKRYVVLRRDNRRCVYCGGRATQVHHKRYAKRNIGKEPIDWLVSVCKSCHDSQHN
jgi:5-methylcytosine-specific restriction endonuclease McrA